MNEEVIVDITAIENAKEELKTLNNGFNEKVADHLEQVINLLAAAWQCDESDIYQQKLRNLKETVINAKASLDTRIAKIDEYITEYKTTIELNKASIEELNISVNDTEPDKF